MEWHRWNKKTAERWAWRKGTWLIQLVTNFYDNYVDLLIWCAHNIWCICKNGWVVVLLPFWIVWWYWSLLANLFTRSPCLIILHVYLLQRQIVGYGLWRIHGMSWVAELLMVMMLVLVTGTVDCGRIFIMFRYDALTCSSSFELALQSIGLEWSETLIA